MFDIKTEDVYEDFSGKKNKRLISATIQKGENTMMIQTN